jgi:hypothetical protein
MEAALAADAAPTSPPPAPEQAGPDSGVEAASTSSPSQAAKNSLPPPPQPLQRRLSSPLVWQVRQVVAWLKALEFSEAVCWALEENSVDGRALVKITNDELQMMGVGDAGERVRLLREMSALLQSCTPENTLPLPSAPGSSAAPLSLSEQPASTPATAHASASTSQPAAVKSIPADTAVFVAPAPLAIVATSAAAATASVPGAGPMLLVGKSATTSPVPSPNTLRKNPMPAGASAAAVVPLRVRVFGSRLEPALNYKTVFVGPHTTAGDVVRAFVERLPHANVNPLAYVLLAISPKNAVTAIPDHTPVFAWAQGLGRSRFEVRLRKRTDDAGILVVDTTVLAGIRNEVWC